ncbi:MAG TPA: toprim domain-containing protein, partial [Lacibacter sp.]|nr:toprim domain-containing protein [Lacibacter sp.]
GIVVERNGMLTDNYRERIIFPIHSNTGKVIGFGARIIGKKENAPKYINTPENEVYVKSKILYGAYQARHAIDKANECLLVEGYTDVISLHQAGIENVMASGGTALTADQLRLIRKYTNNLTILYDGDAAGVKAAMRGLDLALEEGLNVRLVLIPDNEDPDSYVNKLGAEGFRHFIETSKKDVILFQLEVMLKDAGNDSVRKAAAVQTIAESISRLSKAEDFTRQQDYVKRSAELLKIDEAGLHALVNKLIRERISKQEGFRPKAPEETSAPEEADGLPEVTELLNRDEQHERALVRCLIEFGMLPWDEEHTVARLILEADGDGELVENEELRRMMTLYKEWYDAELEPSMKSFLYHEDRAISQLAVTLNDIQHQISLRWKEAPYEINVPTREERYREEIQSVLTYLRLRKIKALIEENQRDMEQPQTPDQLATLIRTHQHLKSEEIRLTRELGTVIFR